MTEACKNIIAEHIETTERIKKSILDITLSELSPAAHNEVERRIDKMIFEAKWGGWNEGWSSGAETAQRNFLKARKHIAESNGLRS